LAIGEKTCPGAKSVAKENLRQFTNFYYSEMKDLAFLDNDSESELGPKFFPSKNDQIEFLGQGEVTMPSVKS
jgi:hypothetical protein